MRLHANAKPQSTRKVVLNFKSKSLPQFHSQKPLLVLNLISPPQSLSLRNQNLTLLKITLRSLYSQISISSLSSLNSSLHTLWLSGIFSSQMWIGGCGYVGFGLAKVGVGMVVVDLPRWVWVCWVWIGQGGCGFAEMENGLYAQMGSLDVDRSSWRRVAWMLVVVDRRHAVVEHGDEVE